MNASDLDLFRESILQLCRAANTLGIQPDRILRTLKRAAWDADEAAVARELRHLESAGLIQKVPGVALTPALVSYATTAKGDHELEARGLLS